MEKTKHSATYMWITFIAVILTLLGVYASVRTVINLVAFDKYPQAGVLSLNLTGIPPFYPREQDCYYPIYPSDQPVEPFVKVDIQPQETSPSPDSKEIESEVSKKSPLIDPDAKEQRRLCLEGVKESIDNMKVNDISQSALFLFLGLGVMLFRKRFFA